MGEEGVRASAGISGGAQFSEVGLSLNGVFGKPTGFV
jgi:hypothetical protein